MSHKWDERFLELAEFVSKWSKDPSTQVGAVVTDEFNTVVGTGYNGFPRGITDSKERLENRDVKYELVVHAEINAIHFANKSVRGCTLYTWPLPPCIRCATQIIQAGIKRVVTPPTADLPDRWKESCAKSKAVLLESGIEVVEIGKLTQPG